MGFWAAIPSIISAGAGLIGDSGVKYTSCPDAPNTEVFRKALQLAPTTVTGELRDAWNATHPGKPFETSLQNLPDFLFHCWGGSDCQVTSTNGKRLNAAAKNVLQYAGADGTTVTPVATQGFGEQVLGVLGDYAGRVRDAAVIEAERTASELARPTVERVAQDKFMEVLPALILGGVVALIVLRR